MNIKCISFDEEQNILTLELNEEAKQFLLEHAVNDLLFKALKTILENESGTAVSGVQSDCSSAKS